MARPVKPDDTRRAVIIRVRASMAEKKRLQASAAEAGLNVSDWIRTRAVGVQPLLRKPNPDREILLRYLAGYGKIGSNLNQISRQLNRKQGTEEFEIPTRMVTQAIEEVRAITQQIRAILDHGSL